MNTELEIILVEDDSLMQAFYLDGLNLTCNVSFCNTVSLAIELSDLVHPNVYIVDLSLPDGSGVALIEKLRETKYGKNALIIVVTATSDTVMHKKAKAAGAQEVLMKPLKRGMLVSTIEALRSLVPSKE